MLRFFKCSQRSLSVRIAGIARMSSAANNGSSKSTLFHQLGLDQRFQSALSIRGILKPNEIQLQVVPHLLSGKDAIVVAETSAGKTLAFLLPLLQSLVAHPPSYAPVALIVAPSSETAKQVYEILNQLLKVVLPEKNVLLTCKDKESAAQFQTILNRLREIWQYEQALRQISNKSDDQAIVTSSREKVIKEELLQARNKLSEENIAVIVAPQTLLTDEAMNPLQSSDVNACTNIHPLRFLWPHIRYFIVDEVDQFLGATNAPFSKLVKRLQSQRKQIQTHGFIALVSATLPTMEAPKASRSLRDLRIHDILPVLSTAGAHKVIHSCNEQFIRISTDQIHEIIKSQPNCLKLVMTELVKQIGVNMDRNHLKRSIPNKDVLVSQFKESFETQSLIAVEMVAKTRLFVDWLVGKVQDKSKSTSSNNGIAPTLATGNASREIILTFVNPLSMLELVSSAMKEFLEANGVDSKQISIHAIHGHVSHAERFQLLKELGWNQQWDNVPHSDATTLIDPNCRVVVVLCTDVMARGIDLPNVHAVVNMDLPRNASLYMHRAGRTARVGALGHVISLVSPPEVPLAEVLAGTMPLQDSILVPRDLNGIPLDSKGEPIQPIVHRSMGSIFGYNQTLKRRKQVIEKDANAHEGVSKHAQLEEVSKTPSFPWQKVASVKVHS